MPPKRLTPEPGAGGSIRSRRNPCYGAGVVAYIEPNFPAMNNLLLETRNEILDIINPEKIKKREDLIKVKSLHAAFAGYAPFINKEEHDQFFKSQEGLNHGDFFFSVQEKLENYLRTQEPCLIPMGLEFNDMHSAGNDGNIMFRFGISTKDKDTIPETDYAPVGALKNLLGLEKGVSWDSTNRKRFTSVTTVLCTVDTQNPLIIDRIKQVLAAHNPTLIALGAQAITNFTIATYNKRTWTRDKSPEKQQHTEIFSEVYKTKPSRIVSFDHVTKHLLRYNLFAKDDLELLSKEKQLNQKRFNI